jgi:hypothetical protein
MHKKYIIFTIKTSYMFLLPEDDPAGLKHVGGFIVKIIYIVCIGWWLLFFMWYSARIWSILNLFAIIYINNTTYSA